MRRLLLFDVDGTLVDVDGAGRAALRSAMEAVYGRTGPIDDFEFRGKTDPAIVRGLLLAAGEGEERIVRGMDRVWPLYLERLEAELEARRGRVRVHPGVRELLERLEADPRFSVGLVTGNVRGGAWRKLASCGLRSAFRFGAFGSDSEHREELPPLALERAERLLGHSFGPQEAWIIGDTPEDIRCARHSGLRALAVATGGYDAPALHHHGAHRVVDTLRDVDGLVRCLAA